MDCTKPGKYGTACEFDGTDDFVDLGDPDDLNITGAVSVSAWIKQPVQNDWYNTIVRRGAVNGGLGSDQYYLAFSSDSSLIFYVANDSSNLVAGFPNGPPLNTWTHVEGVYNGSDTAYLYINGVLVDSDYSAGFGSLNSNWYNDGAAIGCDHNFNQFFDGLIDDVRSTTTPAPRSRSSKT